MQVGQFIGLVLTPGAAIVCVLGLVRRLWRFLPYFMAYLVLLVVVEIARLVVIAATGTNSSQYAWTYWMTQPVLILARGAGLADLCRAALGLYSGVWKLARLLLVLAATFMLTFAALHTGGTRRISSYLIFVERELEFAVVVSLLLLLLLSRYYGVALDRPLDGIAMGLGFYSCVIILCNSMIIGPWVLPWWFYSLVRDIAFFIAEGLWAYALWEPLSERARPALSSAESYAENARVVSDRMRELNGRLLALMKR
jgi:hypothetical protein